jgi:hypothetical protein
MPPPRTGAGREAARATHTWLSRTLTVSVSVVSTTTPVGTIAYEGVGTPVTGSSATVPAVTRTGPTHWRAARVNSE